ncbi:TetR/AcrR family transcriptional regulator [Colwellia psychrerythraea]|uniref:Transcriptional regulator, TetR family n=1 Tax=Colwellia psychrerythraea TaxID=28229 RepID=A0A099KXI6_COLPS|nr:TetR/AcrR family transcriptional regulator [Colwellia psychrerythraea]KGJ94895.1 transcriptional regulator, TetR family [Colwellia psychrerythraea]
MRNAEFDREEVLRATMKAFMHKGYAKTSMQDLKKATGLHPGSIYCAFENKRGLLLAALEQYRLDRKTEFDKLFANSTLTMVNLKAYLDNIVLECVSCDSAQACLLTKALNEIAEQDSEIQQVISNNLSMLQQAIAEKFEQAKAEKSISTNKDCHHLARYFLMGICGLRTFAHTHPEAQVLQQLAEQLYHDVSQ